MNSLICVLFPFQSSQHLSQTDKFLNAQAVLSQMKLYVEFFITPTAFKTLIPNANLWLFTLLIALYDILHTSVNVYLELGAGHS